ncbi:MAG: regulatory protein RecX [Candidatus Omnitrophota bacterium]|nr:regulatory protein RecX [Candidatus Omnitrophota bacterium]
MESDKLKIRAKNNAYMLLRQRPRSEFEIRRRLELKGYDGPVIDGIVEGLKRTGDIDDAKFAKLWMESRMHSSPVGDVVLRHELKEKGVKDSIIEATMADKAGSYDEYEVAFSMAVERFERLKKLDRRKALKRLYDFLMRRGFKYDTVRRINEALTKPTTDNR